MATSATNLLKLKDVVVYQNLGHPLNLSLNFFRQLQAKLDYEGDQPQIKIRGESHPLLTSTAPDKEGGPELTEGGARDQRQSSTLRKNRGALAPPGQISTFPRFKGPGVKMPVNIAITTMCGSVLKKVSPVTEEKETVFATREKFRVQGKKARQDRSG